MLELRYIYGASWESGCLPNEGRVTLVLFVTIQRAPAEALV